jgi:hypothetical protein
MYKIIGADGKEYGPIAAEQLRQWIAEGRVNAQTQILAEGATQWRPLSDFPEFVPAITPGAPPTMAAPASSPQANDQVAGPAIGLMITAGLGFLAQIAGLVMRAVVPMREMSQYPAQFNVMASGLGVVVGIVAIIMSGLIFFGAIKMKKPENYNLAMAASIIAMVPCLSPCCLIGLPIGIWALVILMKPEVKSAFH